MKGSTVTRKSYIYNGDDILLEYNTSDSTPVETARYIGTGDIDDNLMAIKNGKPFFYHKDHLGSVVAITNDVGETVQKNQYSSFGKILSVKDKNRKEIGIEGATEKSFAYTGREWDEEIDLCYYRARHYDPRTGRFLSEDPIGFASGDSNLFRYTSNNPVLYRDPSGNLSGASVTACAIGFAAGELYDIYSNIKAASDLTDATEQKLKDLDEESKTCSSKRKDQIRFERQKILDDYQKNSMTNVLDVFVPGAGAATAAGACLLFISTF